MFSSYITFGSPSDFDSVPLKCSHGECTTHTGCWCILYSNNCEHLDCINPWGTLEYGNKATTQHNSSSVVLLPACVLPMLQKKVVVCAKDCVLYPSWLYNIYVLPPNVLLLLLATQSLSSAPGLYTWVCNFYSLWPWHDEEEKTLGNSLLLLLWRSLPLRDQGHTSPLLYTREEGHHVMLFDVC